MLNTTLKVFEALNNSILRSLEQKLIGAPACEEPNIIMKIPNARSKIRLPLFEYSNTCTVDSAYMNYVGTLNF